jgi:hypothetical protein
MSIKPIETVYNGYHFRSRLEARWAVFFDTAGIEYEYEPEGFILDDGTKYLPDFYLPRFNIYAEIKPSRALDDGKAEKFAFAFSHGEGVGGCLICYGLPSDHNLRFVSGCELDEDGGGCWDSEYGDFNVCFREYLDGSGICLFVDDWKDELSFYDAKNIAVPCYDIGCITDGTYDDSIVDAERKAKQARFEHGEKPNVRSVAV